MRRILPALFFCALQLAYSANCPESLGFYQSQGYYVADIQVQSTLGLVKTALSEAQKAKLLLHKREVNAAGAVIEPGLFDTVALSKDNQTITEGFTRTSGRISAAVSVPSIQQCDDSLHSLKVVYEVFSFNVPVENNGLGDTASVIIRSLAPTSSLGSALNTIFPKLVMGYDHTHRLYGGTNTILKTAPGGLFDSVNLTGLGSSSTSTIGASFAGQRDYSSAIIQHVEWALGYSRSDEPTAFLQIKQSKAFARFSAITVPSSRNVIWHFGGAGEGGNEQTNLPTATASGGAARSPYGAVKLYTALAASLGGSPISVSYALQLGKASPGVSLDYTKHIIDVVHSREWFPGRDRHKAISLEARFTASLSTGGLPLAERFLGGNHENYFIDGDSWRILDQPLIRSFSANRLNPPGPGMYGGDGFLSANTTLAYPVFYHRPLVPAEILKDPDFSTILDGALAFQTRALENHHLNDAPQFVAFRQEVLAFSDKLRTLRQQLNAFAAAGIPAKATSDALSDLDDLNTAFNNMRDSTVADPSAPVVTVAVGFPAQATDALFVTLADDLDTVISVLPPAMSAQKADLQVQQSALRKAVQDPVTGFAIRYPKLDVTVAKKEAAADMKLPTSVLHRFLNELNLVSLSPAIFVDAARLHSGLIAVNPGWRYGVGPGIRFSLVNVNFTIGYSFNPTQRTGEGRGAVNMGLSFGDLFR